MKKNKILIIRLSALGDTIHTLPLAAALRKKYPDSQIDWVVEDKAQKFIVNNPVLNKVYVWERKKQKNENFLNKIIKFYRLIKEIRQEKYDIVIDTQQLFKSSVIMGLSGSKRRLALDGGREFSGIFANEIIKTGRKQFDINYHVVKRNLEYARYLGCQDLNPEFIIPDFSGGYSENIVNIIKNLDNNKKTIVIAPATTWKNKHWTIDGWIDVIKEFQDKYNIILTASEKEHELISKILTGVSDKNNITDLSGQTDLNDLVYIYKNADLIISPDSGSAHIAWAVNASGILTLFFATSALRTAPFGDNYYSVSAKTPCSPCMKKHCRQKKLKNHCLNEIKSAEVINIIKNVLQ